MTSRSPAPERFARPPGAYVHRRLCIRCVAVDGGGHRVDPGVSGCPKTGSQVATSAIRLHALRFARVRGRAEGRVTAVGDVSFTVASGMAVALAGVGGSGHPCQDFPGMSLIPPARCAAQLPHQLSGAQCQPVVTAGALACGAGLIILREPVLTLDVSLRAGVLRLLARLHEDRWLSLLCITHDLLSVRLINENLLLSEGRPPGSARRSSLSLPVRGLRERLRDAAAKPCAAAGGSQAIRHRTALQTRGRCAP